MRRPTLLALLAVPFAVPSNVSAGGTPTFCTDALMGACFYMDALRVEEVASPITGRSDYLHTLTGMWTGSALSGLTDLVWLARFDAYDTSPQGRTVYLFGMTEGEPTQAWHDEWGQPRGLTPMLWDFLAIRIFQGLPGTEGGRLVTACGTIFGDCYMPSTPAIDYLLLTPDEPTDPPTNSGGTPVSVPEPGTWLLLATGMAGIVLAHRRRSLRA